MSSKDPWKYDHWRATDTALAAMWLAVVVAGVLGLVEAIKGAL